MSSIRKKRAREILIDNRAKTSPLSDAFTLLAHNIRSQHNIGALLRSADGFGVHKVYFSGYTPSPPSAAISKTALGAEEYVEWARMDDPIAGLQKLKKNGFTIYGLEQTEQSRPLTDIRPESDRICLILGNEVTGIDERLLPLADHLVEIPQFGNKHSLNVSVAAGIALYAFMERLR